MSPSPDSPRHSGYSRRAVLAAGGSGLLVLAGGSPVRAAAGEAPMQVIVPAVSEFEDNFEGQFLTVEEPAGEADADPDAVHDACSVPWPRDATTASVGQLSDRRSDQPVAVRVPVYMDGSETDLVEDVLFAISSASPCEGDYVQLDVEWVSTRSLVGKPAGPTVDESGNGNGGGPDQAEGLEGTPGADGTGFGLLAGGLGVSGALLVRWLGRNG